MGSRLCSGQFPFACHPATERELAGIEKLAPRDLRRTCARLCHTAGGELEQIQFLLGHLSVQTTERYLGCKQRLRDAVNEKSASNRLRRERRNRHAGRLLARNLAQLVRSRI